MTAGELVRDIMVTGLVGWAGRGSRAVRCQDRVPVSGVLAGLRVGVHQRGRQPRCHPANGKVSTGASGSQPPSLSAGQGGDVAGSRGR